MRNNLVNLYLYCKIKEKIMNSTYSIGSRFCPRCFYFQRAHYGTPRFKPKILKTKPLRTPSMLALDNFDFYYAPLFGKKWPSIRLGLLMPNKFAAVINRYSQGFETNKEIIASLGATNLIENLVNGRESPDEINEMRQKLDEQLSQLRFGQQNFQEIGNAEETQNEIFNLDDRLEGSIKQFLPPTCEIQLGKSRKNEDGEDESKSNARKIIFDSKFTITGLESVDQGMEDELPTLDDIPIYPSSLQTFIYPKMCIDGFPGPIRDNKNISSWWLLDGASILPVLALDLQEDDNVLDMCASPGGKSLMIIQTNKFATLVCNDNKLQRLGQLRRSLGMYIPADSEVFSRIIIKRKDAASVEAWDDIELYDKVIADVPCTTDRLSANQDPGNVFATERTQERLNLPQMQTKMLINALRSVRVGGSVVYSTCSMAPTQNEMVVENAAVLARQNYGIECVERGLKRMEADLERAGSLFHFSDQQKRGSLILPNVLSNFGPMFLCKLQRIR